MTREEIEARLRDMSYRWEADVRKLVFDILAPPEQPPPPPPPPPVEPPPAAGPWQFAPRRFYASVGSGAVVRRCATREELLAALRDQRAGDVTLLTASGDYGKVEWRRSSGHASGVPGRPIVVAAAAGVSPVLSGEGPSDSSHALRVEDLDHVIFSGLTARDSQFPVRVWGCTNWRSEHTTVEDAGHAGFAIQRSTTGRQCADFEVADTTIRRTGRSTQTYGEGFYLGNGSDSWIDTPTRGKILRADISDTRGDAVDLKSGVVQIELGWLRIHDCDVPSGAAISHTQVIDGDDDPHPEVPKLIWGHDIDIWNLGWGGTPASIYGVTCDRGGETFERIRMWGFRPDIGPGQPTVNTRGFNVRGTQKASRYPIVLRDSLIWVDRSIVYYLTGPAVGNSAPVRVENVRTPDGLLGSTKVPRAAGWPGVNVKFDGDPRTVFA